MASTSVTGMAFVDGFRDRRPWDALGFLAFAGAAAAVGVLGVRVLLSRRGHASRAERSSMIVRAISPTEFYSGCAAIFIGVTCSVVWAAGEFVSKSGYPHVWQAISFGLFSLGSLFAWLGAYEVQLSGDVLRYCSLLAGCRAVSLHEIDIVRPAVGWSRKHPYWPIIRLEVIPKDKSAPPLVINLKVFSKKDVDLLSGWFSASDGWRTPEEGE